jgi:hypothetical protein
VQSSHAIKTKITNSEDNSSALKRGLWLTKKIIHTPQNSTRVWSALEQTSQFCAKTYSFIDMADSSLQFLHKYFNLHSYMTWVVQELQNTVSSATQIFYINCWMVWNKMKFMICVWDKTHFSLYVFMNKQNFHYWAKENCQQLHLKPPHSVKVPVWCAISTYVITGPHF